MLTRGELHLLALFDKPDPLDGPFFEETIYVTPSRLAAEMQEQIAQCAARAARALGLTEGPIHAELRLTKDGPSVIEVNARSIGGLCSRMLRFGTGMSLEELIIRHALEEGFNLPERQCQAAGVMMVPVQRAGQFIEVRRLDEAKAVGGIEDVVISAHVGQRLVPLPEGSQYLGFIFSRAESPAAVEAALRESHAQLEFVFEPFSDGEDDGTSLSEECIYRYLVRYGALGHVGRVGSINLIPCRRGDRVVVNTDRGVELAGVLDASQEGVGRPDQERPAGELLRVATDEDRQREADLGDLHRRVLNASIELISERGLSVTAMDAEQLFDGQTIIVYHLGEPTEKLGPVAVDLSKKADNRRVQFQSIEMPPKSDTEDSSQPLERKPKRSKEELIKETSQFLRGTIRDELSWDTDKFSAADVSLLKFHGSYQQDDRDARKQRVSGVGKRHTFMARLKIPGGRLTADEEEIAMSSLRTELAEDRKAIRTVNELAFGTPDRKSVV